MVADMAYACLKFLLGIDLTLKPCPDCLAEELKLRRQRLREKIEREDNELKCEHGHCYPPKPRPFLKPK
jgi:hypothetical protein